jgi:hypothetical protein
MHLKPQQVKVAHFTHNLMTQPDISAGILIYLLENNIITV